MTRLLTAVGSLAAAIAAVGASIDWLSDHVHDYVIFAAGGLAIIALGWYCGAQYGRTRKPRYGGYAIGLLLATGAVTLTPESVLPNDVRGYLFAACALIPLAIDSYISDRDSRTRCPDCDEEIRAAAKVCKHCGFRIAAKPAAKDAPAL